MGDWTAWFFDRLSPARSRDDPALRFGAELVLGFGVFELLITGLFCLSELLWGTHALGVIYALGLVPILVILVWAGRGGNPAHASAALMTVLFTLVTVTNFSTGGQSIGANIALPTVVVFAVLMSSPRAGLTWTLMILAEIVAVSFLRQSHYDFPIKPNAEWVRSAVDRVPLFFTLASVLIAVVTRRALRHFQMSLEGAREIAANGAARFTDFAEIAADGFWETDAELRLTYVSPSFAHAMGLDASQMLGLTPEQAYRVRFPDAPDISSFMEPMRKHRPYGNQMLRMVDGAGQRHLLLNQARPIYGAHGEFIGFRGAVQDITTKRAAEKALLESEQRLRLITDNLPALVAYIDRDQRYRFCNAMMGKVFGVDPATMIGRTMREVRGEEMYGQFADHVKAALAGVTVSFDGKGPGKDREYHYHSDYVPDIGADGVVGGFYAMTFDITAIKEAEIRAATAERRLRLITDNVPALISYIDAEKVFRFNNTGYETWLRRPLSEITGRRLADVYDSEMYQRIERNIDRALAGELVTFELAVAGPSVRHIRVTYVPETDSSGKVLGIFGLIHDITELKKIENELRQIAQFDTLTGLANRHRYNDKMAEAIARSERNGSPIALMFLDLDRFKSINDSLGHKAGDLVLQEFARRLTLCVRQTDTVARLAGDEFVIVLEGLHASDEATIVAEKILAEMAVMFDILGHQRQLSTSIGIAIRRSGETDSEALLRRADEALYAAKEAGRATFRTAE